MPFFQGLALLLQMLPASFSYISMKIDYCETSFFSTVIGRRTAVKTAVEKMAFSSCLAGGVIPEAVSAYEMKQKAVRESYTAYALSADSSPNLEPTVSVVSQQQLIERIAVEGGSGSLYMPMKGALWLGEHHNSAQEHAMQANIIRSIYEKRKLLGESDGSGAASSLYGGEYGSPPLAIGLEQVQLQFQPILDDFVIGKISEDMLRNGVQWEKRWSWPFEVYRPLFSLAQELRIPLIALNVNSEDLAAVEKDGLPGLEPSKLRTYIKDPKGFAEFAKQESFKEYASYVIEPSYYMHKQMGLLRSTITGQMLDQQMPFRNFLSGRILWDECMASVAHSWNVANPGGLIVGLVGADHVKFVNGVPGRYSRMAGGKYKSISIMMNPTLIDTRPPGSVSNSDSISSLDNITLQLRYLEEGTDSGSVQTDASDLTGGVLPLADYILLSARSS